VPPKVEAWLALSLVAVACGSTAPRYVVTASPIEVGAGLHFCVAVDATDAAGVWWWQPGHSGCTTRSTGPGVFRGEKGAVTTRQGTGDVDARFRVGLIRIDPTLPEFLDVHLVIAGDVMSAPATGARVATERRRDLDVPERP
jgi:hypothetical protein